MREKLQKILKNTVSELQNQENWSDFNWSEIKLERVREEQFGDFATNIAMVLAGKIQKNPREIAEKIVEKLKENKNEDIGKVEVAGPGYINFYLSENYFTRLVQEIVKKEKHFGDSTIGGKMKVNNEFISANPTGPLHLGNGRGGFLGDCLSKVLKKCDYDVANEYYINDAGEQVVKLGHSVLKDDEAVYAGEYIDEVRNDLNKGESLSIVGAKAAKMILENYIQKTVKDRMQINFDSWISEKKDLVDSGYVEKAIEKLREKNLTYQEDDALWLRTTQFGDDKDRVLVKGDGQKTYFASDCGYILYKMERGFEKIIEIWGADHHGYIQRFEAAARALGFQGEIKFIIVQLVRLVKDGQEVKMSKRAGNVIYIDDLIERIGHDVARFFFLMYSADTHMNFDLGLAEERSQKNPVFYVQYAHARIASILEKSKDLKIPEKKNIELLKEEKELSLIKELDKFPDLVEEVARSYEVQKLPHYAIGLADKFHSFYNQCQVIDEENLELSGARLELIRATKVVLGEVLRLIGVEAPDKM